MNGELPGKAHPAGELDTVFQCRNGATTEVEVCGVDQGGVGPPFNRFGGSMHKCLGTCVQNLEVDQSVLNDLERGKRDAECLAFQEVTRDGLDGPTQRTDGVGARQQLRSRRQPDSLATLDRRRSRIAQSETMKAPCGVETPALFLEGDPLVSMDCGTDGSVFVRHDDDLGGESCAERKDP